MIERLSGATRFDPTKKWCPSGPRTGYSPQTLYGWIAAYKAHPVESFVGSGRLKAEDQGLRDWQRRIRDLEEENAILKKQCASSPTISHRSFMNTASPSRSRRGARSSTYRDAGLRHGSIALPVLRRKSAPGGSNGFERCLRRPANGMAAQNHRRVTRGDMQSAQKRWYG